MGPDEKNLVDGVGLGTVFWAFVTDNVPTIVLIVTLIWTLIRIYETDTVQKLLGKTDGKSSSSE